jgi:hypothetical protein
MTSSLPEIPYHDCLELLRARGGLPLTRHATRYVAWGTPSTEA